MNVFIVLTDRNYFWRTHTHEYPYPHFVQKGLKYPKPSVPTGNSRARANVRGLALRRCADEAADYLLCASAGRLSSLRGLQLRSIQLHVPRLRGLLRYYRVHPEATKRQKVRFWLRATRQLPLVVRDKKLRRAHRGQLLRWCGL